MQDILLFLQQHWALTLTVIIVFFLLMILEMVKIKQGASRISSAQAINLINHKNAVILDIRSADAFKTGHIVGSLSYPLKELDEKNKKLEKFKSQPIVLVCNTGTEATKAADLLKRSGFEVYVLEGGIRGWRDAEMPLVKD